MEEENARRKSFEMAKVRLLMRQKEEYRRIHQAEMKRKRLERMRELKEKQEMERRIQQQMRFQQEMRRKLQEEKRKKQEELEKKEKLNQLNKEFQQFSTMLKD